MAQKSMPQDGLIPGDGEDCGAYTAKRWRRTLIAHNRSGGMAVTGAAAPPGLPATQQFPNVGVYYATPNQLAVSSPAAAQITIDTGMAIVDGTILTSDEAITAEPVTIPAGVANSRVDIVVVRQNYTNAVYTPTYAPGLTVPANTARITVISGAEAVGPVAPTLTQDEDRLTYWDIPLYQYEIIHTSGVISAEVDLREWVDAEMKRIHVSANAGYDATAAANVVNATNGTPCAANNLTRIGGTFVVPNDFISDMIATEMWEVGAGPGDVYIRTVANYGVCGEGFNTHTHTIGLAVVSVGAGDIGDWMCTQPLALTSAAVGDLVTLTFTRSGTDALDTLGTSLYYGGWYVDYFGWGRR